MTTTKKTKSQCVVEITVTTNCLRNRSIVTVTYFYASKKTQMNVIEVDEALSETPMQDSSQEATKTPQCRPLTKLEAYSSRKVIYNNSMRSKD